jgi:hypothetical protein
VRLHHPQVRVRCVVCSGVFVALLQGEGGSAAFISGSSFGMCPHVYMHPCKPHMPTCNSDVPSQCHTSLSPPCPALQSATILQHSLLHSAQGLTPPLPAVFWCALQGGLQPNGGRGALDERTSLQPANAMPAAVTECVIDWVVGMWGIL